MKIWTATFILMIQFFCNQVFAQNQSLLQPLNSSEISIKDLSEAELKELSTIFKDESEFFRQMDVLFRQNLDQPVKTLVDTNSVVPLLVYALENNTSDAFEMSVLEHAKLDLKEQSEFILRVINKIETDPLLLFRMQKSVQRIEKRIQNLKPRWNWFAQRTINSSLAIVGMLSFLYSFDSSFIYPELKRYFASEMQTAMNLMFLYAGTTIIADILAFKINLRNYLDDRKVISNAKKHIIKIKEVLGLLQSDQSTSSILEFATYVASPQSRELVKKWIQNRQETFRDQIAQLKQKPTAWFQLKSRLLKKELEQFQEFSQKAFVEDRKSDRLTQYKAERTAFKVMNETPKAPTTELEQIAQLEAAHANYEKKFQELDLVLKKGQRNVNASTFFLSISVALISFHAGLGKESSYLDNLTSPDVMNFLRQNTLYIYYAAAAMVVYPLKNFWFGVGNFRNVAKSHNLQKSYFEESKELFSKKYLKKHLYIAPSMCKQLFYVRD